MKRILTLILILSSISLVRGEGISGTVKGIVKDSISKEFLSGAEVWWVKGNGLIKFATTNENGEFALKGIEDGKQIIRVHFNGYTTLIKAVYIIHNHTQRLEFSMVPTTYNLGDVVIIGNAPNAIRKTHGTATKIDKKTVESINATGTDELVNYTPGVNVFSDDGTGASRVSIGIRGLYPRRSSRILVLEDGIPIQPAIYVYPNMYYNPPVERIEEIEIIKGSGAILHGPQTMGGVINYITKRPRKDFGGKVQLTTGNNGYNSFYTEIGGFGSEKIHPEVQLLYKKGNGFRDNNDFEQFNGTFKMRVFPNSKSYYYIKANLNKEVSNATYTGLTEYSFNTDPKFNPKENDEFRVLRSSLDFILHKEHTSKIFSTTKFYTTFFDRTWWRENDIFVDADTYQVNEEPVAVPYYHKGNLMRVGNGKNNFGILRSFYTVGFERTFDIEHKLFGALSNLNIGGRLHWERFIDDKKTGFSPQDRSGKYFVVKGVDPEWDILNDSDPFTQADSISILGQSHHYETMAVSLHMMEKINISKLSLSFGTRFEVFEQERIDRMQGNYYEDNAMMVLLPGAGFNYEIRNDSIRRINLFGGVHRGFTPPSSGALKILNFGSGSSLGLDLKSEKSWNSVHPSFFAQEETNTAAIINNTGNCFFIFY